jgi:hypothetical protein
MEIYGRDMKLVEADIASNPFWAKLDFVTDFPVGMLR